MEELTEEEFDWFLLLTDTEKILFLYNKIISKEEPQMTTDLISLTDESLATSINDLYTVIFTKLFGHQNFLINFYHGVIIIAATEYISLIKMRKRLISDGFIYNLVRTDINQNSEFKYLEILELVNTADPLSLS